MEPTIKVTFKYRPGPLGPMPEDESVHWLFELQSAQNLVTYNLGNEGLISVTIEFEEA